MHRAVAKAFSRARQLCRNMTEAEAKIWTHLRAHRMGAVHFRRQHAIRHYIVDFCAPRQKLIIELDGSHHLEQAEYDEGRTRFLESKGYKVLRFWNNDVMKNIDSVLTVVWDTLRDDNQECSKRLDLDNKPSTTAE